MSEGRQTVAGAYAAIDKHEAVCAERYDTINSKIGLIFKIFAWGLPSLAAVLVAVASWSLGKVYDGQARQLDELRALRNQVTATSPPR